MNSPLAQELSALNPRGKEPSSCRALEAWIAAAERATGAAGGGRIGWLVASTVAAAKLQQVIDDAGESRFMLKGGTMLQYRLGNSYRATKDVDGVVRGNLNEFVTLLDGRLDEPWGAMTFTRTEVEVIPAIEKVIKPLRFHIILSVSGKTWRRVQVEITADEGRTGTPAEPFQSPSLAFFGLPSPDELIGISMAYQFAEKLHGATAPHDPPERANDRARDVVDLVLIICLSESSGSPSRDELIDAIQDVYEARAKEAETLGLDARNPSKPIVPFAHWAADYARATKSAGLGLSLDEAVSTVNEFVGELLS